MKVEIKTVESKGDLKVFVKIPLRIYAGDVNFVPQLLRDEMELFDREKNPAYENADSRLFIALADGKPVGRLAAVISHVANQKYQRKNLRFGWFDTIDDYSVAEALFNAAEAWGRERGMETLTGPHGFCDLDPEGMLIDGFETLPTIVGIYNRPYAPRFAADFGFEKDVDYFEYLTQVPHETGIPEKLLRLARRLKERSSVRLKQFASKKEMLAVAPDIFLLINEVFEELYGTVPFSDAQIRFNVDKYISFADPRLLKVAVNENDEVVGFMFTVPSLSRAFQKAKGRLLPFGIFHLLRGLKSRETLDFYMAGVKKEYQGRGIDLLMVVDIVQTALELGFQYAESNLELESNTKVQALWKHFNPKRHRVRRIFKKKINI